MHDLCELRAAVSFFLHELTDVSKANLLWAQGLLHLSLLFHFASGDPNSQTQCLRQKCLEMNVAPASCRWDTFSVPCAVYCTAPVEPGSRGGITSNPVR